MLLCSVVYMTTTTHTTYTATATKNLASWIRKVDRWHAKCARLSAARSDVDSVEYDAALAAWRKGGMPSKVSKYRAYDLGAMLVRELNLDCKPAQSVDDLREIVRLAS